MRCGRVNTPPLSKGWGAEMSWRRRTRASASISAALLVASFAAVSGGPAASADTGTVAWFSFGGGSEVAAATAQALLQGQGVKGAQGVEAQLAHLTDSSTSSWIRSQLNSATDDDVQNVVSSLLAYQDPAAPDTVGATSAAPASASASATTASEPVQATHGQPTANTPYNWVLHGHEPTPIYYGTCSVFDNSCTTGGFINVSEDSNTVFPPDAFYYLAIRQGAGVHASFSSHQVRVFQDISNATDPVKGNLGCSTSGTNALDCTGNVVSPNVTGNWYYYREDFRLMFGINTVSVQIQTRRWNVTRSNNWEFTAYYYGG